jgi:hypothetical protein
MLRCAQHDKFAATVKSKYQVLRGAGGQAPRPPEEQKTKMQESEARNGEMFGNPKTNVEAPVAWRVVEPVRGTTVPPIVVERTPAQAT